ncbi:MAG TPA: anti-sigma regulatory factor [Casimicrobiaceae bacterium]
MPEGDGDSTGAVQTCDLRLPIRASEDVVRMRQVVRERAVALGFGLVDQTKLVTAASELARNALIHGGGGEAEVTALRVGERSGLRLEFIDRGPGIPDIQQAMQDGFTTGSGLGLGLGGARRLASEFRIASTPGQGTRVTIVRWR